jgi:hypothetical protein
VGVAYISSSDKILLFLSILVDENGNHLSRVYLDSLVQNRIFIIVLTVRQLELD